MKVSGKKVAAVTALLAFLMLLAGALALREPLLRGWRDWRSLRKCEKELQEGDDDERLRAVWKLQSLYRPSWTAGALIRALRDENPTVSANAARALGVPGLREAVPALIDVIREYGQRRTSTTSHLTLRMAVDSLGKIGPAARSAVPLLLDTMEDRDGYLRAKVILALGGIGPDARAAVPLLVGILKKREYASWEYWPAAGALKKIDPGEFNALNTEL